MVVVVVVVTTVLNDVLNDDTLKNCSLLNKRYMPLVL